MNPLESTVLMKILILKSTYSKKQPKGLGLFIDLSQMT